MDLSAINGRILKVEKIDVLEDSYGVVLKIRVLIDVDGTQVGLNLNLKTNYGEVNRLFSRTKSLLSQPG